MSDPYSILGVDRNATDEEIKKAYRALSRKYHPDANINNPHKDEAEAKFKEVQQAYQQIMDERERGYSSDSSYGNAGGGYQEYGPFGGFGGPFGGYGPGGYRQGSQNRQESEEDVHLRAAANYIRSGHYSEALNVLNGIAERDRNARWHYYAALANAGLGNNIRAQSEARAAVDMEPGNYEYQNLLDQLQNPGRTYTTYQQGHAQPGRGNSVLRFCATLWVFQIIMACCCGGRGYYFCC